ncbi:MAG: iron-containing alcohol dehydrogenase family protein [Clostridia bacterium]|jgi:glycerol dehydrogenase|nr:iron-containing alcohol dehydrogenase family protein [Clostridia bacterium]MCI1999352.1 iron-containing alcohol dehydrogenase family protein [Clostridia bacterium]MCI2015146.1 iron-containing alcohol dehydrogenase family protein [Clostridia bacterium]
MSNFISQFLPCYTVGPDAYENVPNICRRFGTKAVAVGGHRALAAAKPELEKALAGSDIKIIDYIWYGGEASIENSEMVAGTDSYKEADMIFAVGGGKALDTCKYAAMILSKKPIFTFPTIAATCAPASAEAIMYYPNGVARDTYQCGRPAEHIFINTKIIAEAPDLYLWAGIGDTMAKHFETELAARGKEVTYKQALGVEIGTMCYKPLVKYGAQAIDECKANKAGNDLEQIALTNIITTGTVSALVGVTINSNVAHSLCYGLTVLPQVEKNHLHGEIVSYCTLVLLFADGQDDKVDELFPLYKAIHLPTKLADLEVKTDELGPVIEKALSVDDIKFVPYKVTAKQLMDAIVKLENYNNK